MGARMRLLISFCFLLLLFAQQAYPADQYSPGVADRYSQKTLLKNWAFCVCLAAVSKDSNTKEDANSTASAYLEFGRQSIEAYNALRELAEQYANKKYGGSIKSEFNTMKCIDLFHSEELDKLAEKLSGK